MWRRIYFSFPSAKQARQVVAELEIAGLKRDQIHTIAKPEVGISGLPVANEAQRSDEVWRWDQLFWYGNLIFFAVMLAAAALSLYAGLSGLAIVAALLAVISYLVGERFAVKVPHVHLSEMRVPIDHGEVVLLIDIPHARVREIEQLVTRQHPEAALSGIGWTIVSAGI